MHVIPRPQNARQLHNSSLLKMPLRQRPATAGIRTRGTQYSAVCGSPNSQSPQLTIVVPSLSEAKQDYLLNNCFNFQEKEEEGAMVIAKCSVTPPKQQQMKMEEENDSNSINRGGTSSGSTIPNRDQKSLTPENKRAEIRCSSESQMSSPPASSQQQQQDSESPSSSDGIDQMGDNNREQPLAGSSDEDRAPKRPSCRRNLAKELEKELTFRPELNQKSLKIASRSTRQSVPLLCRLTERRKQYVNGISSNGYTFAPKINAHSIRLAQERAGKIQEV